jgi:hypothetical protein
VQCSWRHVSQAAVTTARFLVHLGPEESSSRGRIPRLRCRWAGHGNRRTAGLAATGYVVWEWELAPQGNDALLCEVASCSSIEYESH